MNLLSEKVQKDFEGWLLDYNHNSINIVLEEDQQTECREMVYTRIDGYVEIDSFFYDLPIGAQFGIFQDYFWQKYRYWIEAEPFLYDKFQSEISEILDLEHPVKDTLHYDDRHRTIEDARVTVLEEASKLAQKQL